MVDASRVRQRLRRLDELLAYLEEVRESGESAFLADLERRLATEHALQVAVQVCIDVGAHVVSELGLPAPDEYRGVFGSLAAQGLLPGELAQRLGDAAGLRNVLVHGYEELDERRVFAALGELDDLRAFAAAVLAAVERDLP